MNKKIIWTVVVIIGLVVGWYLLSPIWRDVELNEASPLSADRPEISDAFESMDAVTRAEFESETEKMKSAVMEKSESMPTADSQLIAEGNFVSRAHEVAGRALLIEANGKKIIRFEDFETINGPDLRIYLSSSLGNEDFVDLGPIRATVGNVNYVLPDGVDTNRYDKVLVWCRAFRVLFSYADLEI